MKELCAQTFPNDTIAQRKLNFDSLMAHARAIVDGRKDGIIPTLTKFEHGVFCLSEINDDILMWSHYADCHKGVCVSVRPDCLQTKRIVPVEYCDRLPLIDAWEYVGRNAETFVELSRTKSSHWHYEKEWRTIDRAGARRFPECVDRVVIGALASAETRADVLEAVADASHEILVFEATLSESHYKLTIAPIS